MADTPAAPPLPPERLAAMLADLVRDAVPHEYEKLEDWNRTKRITTGLDFDGKLASFRFKRRKKPVDHGLWKHYRAWLIDPEESLDVQVQNLRSVAPGRAACTLVAEADVAGWARVRHYNRGVHLGTFTFRGDSVVRIAVDCEVGFTVVQGKYLPALQLQPHISATRVAIKDFHLDRVSKVGGEVAEAIGRGMKEVVEEKLDGPKLTRKLNAAIEKKQDRLRFDVTSLAGAIP